MRLMPARASGPSPSSTSPSTAAPPRWPGARAGGPTPCWAGCTPITRAAPTRSRSAAPAVAVPFLPTARSRARRGGLRGPAHGGHPTPRRGRSRAALDVAPPGQLGAGGGEASGWLCGPKAPRGARPRRKLSWTKAKKLLGRANPEQRQAFIEQFQGVLAGAQRERQLSVYLVGGDTHPA